MRNLKFRYYSHSHEQMIYSDDLAGGLEEFFSNSGERRSDVMQFTGLQDKNGADIYEGDILENESGRCGGVYWVDKLGQFDTLAMNDVGDSYGLGNCYWRHCATVIGNIHEGTKS